AGVHRRLQRGDGLERGLDDVAEEDAGPLSAERGGRLVEGGAGHQSALRVRLQREPVPVRLAAPRRLDARGPVGIDVVGELDLHAHGACEAGRLEVAEERGEVELALAERREVEDALAAALVLQVDVPDAVEGVPDVVLGADAGGDWSWVPPRANTIGPREILGAAHRSFWLDGDLGGGCSWQRFIARLVAHGPVSEFVPGSILQTAPTDYTLLGGVADDVEIHMA